MNKGPLPTKVDARRVSGESLKYFLPVLALPLASVSDGDRTLCSMHLGLIQYHHVYVRVIPLYAG